MKIDNIRLLRLSRSAPSLLTAPGAAPQDGSEVAWFSLFDYFDGLVVRKGDTLDYRACFGLDQPAATPPLASSEYLTLVSLAGEEEESGENHGLLEGDPFFGGDGQDLSALPFLSVMMVTVLPDPIAAPTSKERGVLIRPDDVDRFLRTCTASLRQWVREVGGEFYAGDAALQAVYRVYNCMNSGNFCLVTRSRSPELTYHISMRMRAKTLRQDGNDAFPHLDCSTYSLVGLACPDCVNPQTFLKDETSNAEVALRLSVINKVRNSLFQYAAGCMTEDLRGLYGRYDVTLRLNLRQFGQLYPWISAKKLGRPLPVVDETEEVDGIVRLLRRSLCDQGAQCINVRLLLHMEGTTAQDNDGARRKSRQDKVEQENAAVTELLQEVARLGDGLVDCQDEYRTSLRLLQDLWESYSSLRYQDDSFIDGNILLVQVRLLLDTVKRYLGSVQQKRSRKSDYETLSKSLRFAINSIDHFQKLMLSINQQSMQAPNYEVQMHCDMEKFVVAYTEFSRRFLSEHFRPLPSGSEVPLEKRRQLIFPIITVNTTLNAIRALPLFLLPYWEGKDELLYSNGENEQILLSIEVPENGLLGDIYVILPLICHELFHNFRVLGRKERNDALARYLFRRIAQFIVRRWISQTAEKNIYHAFGRLEEELYIDELAVLLWDAYQERCGASHKTANIGVLINNIRVFLVEDIFNQWERSQLQRPELTLEQVKEQLDWLCRLALDASGSEKPEWGGEYQACRDGLAQTPNAKEEDWDRLSKQLVPLAKRLALIVVEGHSQQVRRAGDVFLEKLEESRREAVREALEEICGGAELRKLIVGSESVIDQWIIKADGCRRRLSLLSGKWDGAAHAARMLDHIICDMFRSVKDANHLYLLLASWNRYQNKPYKKKTRDQLIRNYHARIRQTVDGYYTDREAFWLLHSAPSVHELTAPLGGDLEEEEMFAKPLKGILLSTAQKDVFEIIDSSTTLYREIFADMGMCVSLGLSAFGYLNVLSHNGSFQALDSQSANLKLDRMRIVCLALLQEAGLENAEAVEQLRSDGRICARELARHMEPDMCADERTVQNWQRIREWIEDLLDGKKELRSVNAFRLTLEVFGKWFRAETPTGVVQDMYGQLKSMWILAHLINNLHKFVDNGMSHPLQPHFSELLPVIRRQWQEDEAQTPGSSILQKVGGAYSDPSGIKIFLNEQERFQDTLSFVLYYYYHGWSVYGWSDRSDMEGWLNSLMGGAPL